MGVVECRQVVILTVAFLAGILWFRRRRHWNKDPPAPSDRGLLTSTPALVKIPPIPELNLSPISQKDESFEELPQEELERLGEEADFVEKVTVGNLETSAEPEEFSGDQIPEEEKPEGIISGVAEEPEGIISGAAEEPEGIILGAAEEPEGIISRAAEEPEGIISGAAEELERIISGEAQEPEGIISGVAEEPEGIIPGEPEGIISGAAEEPEGVTSGAAEEPERVILGAAEEPERVLSGAAEEPEGIISAAAEETAPEEPRPVAESETSDSEVTLVEETGDVRPAESPEEGDYPSEEQKGEQPAMEKGVLEEKLASLVLDTMKMSGPESGKGNAERDSANQSPSEVMLASPSISNFSDAHSEGSSDSGKGNSDVATSPSRTPAGGSSLAGDPAFSVYEFILPQVMVGRLIGRHGSFIHEIRTSTHTNIFIKRHPDTSKLKICAIEGTQQDIDKALAKIRQKFPIRRFPKLTLEKVSFISVNNPPPLNPEDFYLQLVEGVNNDVILSSLITAAHFYLQQPSHPTYTALSRLNHVMNSVYSNAEAPALEAPVKDAICAAPTMGGWYRAQIMCVDEENRTCDVKFVDYGGYLTLKISVLRQIRGDLLLLPFQAVECYLANVVPVGDEVWSEEARLVVQGLTHGQLLQAQIYDYAEDGTPQVYLYSTLGSKIILVNEELVARGFATIRNEPAEEPEE